MALSGRAPVCSRNAALIPDNRGEEMRPVARFKGRRRCIGRSQSSRATVRMRAAASNRRFPMRNLFTAALPLILPLVPVLASGQEEPAKGVRFTELQRAPAARQVKRIAILPPVIVLRFDPDGRLPSPDRFTIRRAVANELAPGVRELL